MIQNYKESQKKLLQLRSIPALTIISSLEIDVTLDCNLACQYCYKRTHPHVYMNRRTAFDIIVWLMYASANIHNLTVFFMGGEPLLQFSLIKDLVPFAKHRAKQHGKKIDFGLTTNCTLITDEVVDFLRTWNFAVLCSIDGIPESQNTTRPTKNGGHSSHLLEKGVHKLLDWNPNLKARLTIVPQNINYSRQNYRYIRQLGFKALNFGLGDADVFTNEDLIILNEQLSHIAEEWADDIRSGNYVVMTPINEFMIKKGKKPENNFACGAGQRYGMIDYQGNFWPCSRWAIQDPATWAFGNIYDRFYEEKREQFLKGRPNVLATHECADCMAGCFCDGQCMATALESMQNPLLTHPNFCAVMKMWGDILKKTHDQLYFEKCPLFMKMFYPAEIVSDI